MEEYMEFQLKTVSQKCNVWVLGAQSRAISAV